MPCGGVAAVAHAPDHQRGAAHDVAAGEHARQAGHHACCQSIWTVPQRLTLSSGSPNSAGQVLGIEAQRLDHQVGLEPEARARARSRAPGGRMASGAPRRIRCARTASTRPSPRNASGAESQTNSTPSSSALRDLAHRARHVGAVAPVEALDRSRALADRGAHAVHGGVAAADHDHVLAGGVQRAGVEGRHRVAQALAVAGGEIVQRRHDARRGRTPGTARSRAW